MSDLIITGAEDSAALRAPAPALSSAVSWGAVFAGGVSAAAIAGILTICGAGLGLSAVSPWRGQGVGIAGFTVFAAIWLIIVQWVSSFMGGYMAGRLRSKYTLVHTDEVFFRDTAHGFLAWALSVLFMALVVFAGGASGAGGAAGAAKAAAVLPASYYSAMLFRAPAGGGAMTGSAAPGVSTGELYAQAGAILGEQAARGGVPADDQAYLAQLVSEKTGLTQAQAQARVAQVLGRETADEAMVKRAADAARKTAALALLYGFFSLLIGAFIASVAGAIGGRLRDSY